MDCIAQQLWNDWLTQGLNNQLQLKNFILKRDPEGRLDRRAPRRWVAHCSDRSELVIWWNDKGEQHGLITPSRGLDKPQGSQWSKADDWQWN